MPSCPYFLGVPYSHGIHSQEVVLKLHARGLTVLVGAAALATAALSVTPAQASPTKSTGVRNPYSPAYGHSYRHGAIPTRELNTKMKGWAKQHANAAATGAKTLSY